MNKEKIEIGVVGLGYVGLPLAVSFAQKYTVKGFDINKQRIHQLKSGFDITEEVESGDLKNAHQLSLHTDITELSECNVFIVTVPTPVDPKNKPDLSSIYSACTGIAQILKLNDIVVFESTVYPGATEEVCVPLLEKYSNLKYNVNFFVGYSPERINPGDKRSKFTNTSKIVSGSNEVVAEQLKDLYSTVISASVHKADSIKVAEASKVIENAQRDVNIAFMNEVSQILYRLGIDSKAVFDAAATKWNFIQMNPGLVGGHCIGVDPHYLIYKAEMSDCNAALLKTARSVNEDTVDFAASEIIKKLLKSTKNIEDINIGVFGVTFKENCPDIRNSKIFPLINCLKNAGFTTYVFDPVASEIEVEREHGVKINCVNPEKFLDCAVIAVGHNQYRSMGIEGIFEFLKTDAILVSDLKSIYSRKKIIESGYDVFSL